MKLSKQQNYFWKGITVLEIGFCVLFILKDIFMPTILLLGLMILSLIIRREKIGAIGFKRPQAWKKIVVFSFFIAVAMQLVDAGVTMPVMNRLTGAQLEYSNFSSLQGDIKQLLTLLLVAWILAAFGEEIAYRGYLTKLFGDLFGSGLTGTILSVVAVSGLFGLVHAEQGIVGIIITASNAVVFSWLKIKFNNNLWPAILTHGIYNSVGLIVFFFFGPIYGLW